MAWAPGDVRLLVDKDSGYVSRDTLEKFAAHGSVRSLAGLHAKLYVIDDAVLLTSANLTGYAFTKRHEIGVVFEGGAARDLVNTFDAFWKLGTETAPAGVPVPKPPRGGDEPNGCGLPALWRLPEMDPPAAQSFAAFPHPAAMNIPLDSGSDGKPDRDTFKDFSGEQLARLAVLRRDLGSAPLRNDVKIWYQRHTRLKYAQRWIVHNRYIVTRNPDGPDAICILDPEKMPEHPFPRVRERKK